MPRIVARLLLGTLVISLTPTFLNAQARLSEIHKAARDGKLRVLEQELAKGVPVDSRTSLGETPLHWPAGRGQPDAVRVLLKHKADPNSVDLGGRTSLSVACSAPMVQLLLDAGADPNRHEHPTGQTPLREALRCKGKDSIRLLLERGAKDVPDAFGVTALHAAAARLGTAETVELLAKASANVNVPNVQGLTPRDMAAVAQRTDVLGVLDRHGAKSLRYTTIEKPGTARLVKGARSEGISSLMSSRDSPAGLLVPNFPVDWAGKPGGLGFRGRRRITLQGHVFLEPNHTYVADHFAGDTAYDSVAVVKDSETQVVVGRLIWWK